MDFLSVTHEWILEKALLTNHTDEVATHGFPLCILSNPPFAENSRGDYSAVVKFINHALNLDADYIGLIVPDKFARQRVWQSLGMNPRAHLLARCLLPEDSFYDPSSLSCRRINTYFLFFNLKGSPTVPLTGTFQDDADESLLVPRITVQGKRSKGDFPWINTAELRDAVACSLRSTGFEMNASGKSSLVLSAELKALNSNGTSSGNICASKSQATAVTRQLHLASHSRTQPWMAFQLQSHPRHSPCLTFRTSTQSLRTLVNADSTAWTSEELGHEECGIILNAMCGEGTIELESQDLQPRFFMIAGDKSEDAVRRTAERLASLHGRQDALQERRWRPPVDLVVWDAQRLPLRSGIVDVFLADLPFVGGKAKKHQEPSISGNALDNTLDYKRVMAQAARVLKCRAGQHYKCRHQRTFPRNRTIQRLLVCAMVQQYEPGWSGWEALSHRKT
ncbi:tRNA (guanine) methyltransferase [Fragilaria crotonensis]|nr:tRNA (guanine) methyltransferase [Fragilaria crotonensis]